MPPDIQSQTKCSADEVEDCCAGNGVGMEHQRDADPFDLVERQALAVAVGGKADQARDHGWQHAVRVVAGEGNITRH